MRHAGLVAIFCFIAAPIAQAQETTPQSSANSNADRVQLIEDDEMGVIRFVIDGKEVGRFGATGLRVEGLVEGSEGVVTQNVNGQPLPGPATPKGGAP